MYPIPPDVLNALNGSCNISGHVDILRSGLVVVSAPIESASVTVSRTAAQRRTCSVVLADSDGSLVPENPDDPVAPNGNEIRVWYDIALPTGVVSVPMITATIVTVKVEDTGVDLTLTVQGADRSWFFGQLKFITPYTVAASISPLEAVQQMLVDMWPGAPLNLSIAPTDALTPSPAGVIRADKPVWQAATLLAQSAGMELFFDPLGTCVMQPVPDPSTVAPCWVLTDLNPSALKGVSRTLTRDKVYSAYEVIGVGSVPTVLKSGKTSIKHVPILAVAEDANPNSPTYAQGPFGVVAEIVRTTFVTSAAQGQAMAEAALAQQLGKIESVVVHAIPNPALDIDDVVTVERSRAWTTGNYVVDSVTFTIGLEPSMQIGGRKVSP